MPVLRRTELEDSPLADLHAIASELGLESYRSLRKADLVNLILKAQGGDDGEEPAAPEAEAEEPAAEEPVADEEPAEKPTANAGDDLEDDDGPDEVPAEEALEARPRRRRRGGRRRGGADREEEREGREARGGREAREDRDEDEDDDEEREVLTGVLDVLPNGSGFLRVEGGGSADVYVSPAQIRRCELRTGDDVAGPVRPRRRNERHPSLVRVDTVNGRDAEPPEERPLFEDLTAVFPSRRLDAPAAFGGIPLGFGSRVAIGGPAGAGATTLLRELVGSLAKGNPDLDVQVVLAGVRPEEVPDWRAAAGSAPVTGGSFDGSADAQAQAAELAVERAKRRVERGADALVAIDSLESLPPSARRRVFGAARATEGGGTLTVVAVTGDSPEALRWATTRVVLERGGSVSTERSGTLRADDLNG